MNLIYAHYSPTNKQASAVGDFLGFTPLNRSKEKALEHMLDNPGGPSLALARLGSRASSYSTDALDPQTAALMQDPEVKGILKDIRNSQLKRVAGGALGGAAWGAVLGGGVGAIPGAGLGAMVNGWRSNGEIEQKIIHSAKLQALKEHVKSVIAKHKLEQENPAHHIDPADIDESKS